LLGFRRVPRYAAPDFERRGGTRVVGAARFGGVEGMLDGRVASPLHGELARVKVAQDFTPVSATEAEVIDVLGLAVEDRCGAHGQQHRHSGG
jgi:hypothetical protein